MHHPFSAVRFGPITRHQKQTVARRKKAAMPARAKGDRVLAFYRSSGFRLIQILTGIVAAVSLAWPGKPQWRSTPSLKLIHETRIPWAVWSVVFVVYVVLLIWHTSKSSELADWIGLFCGLVFGVAFVAGFRWNSPFNWVATGFLFDGIAAHYAAARLAHFDRPHNLGPPQQLSRPVS